MRKLAFLFALAPSAVFAQAAPGLPNNPVSLSASSPTLVPYFSSVSPHEHLIGDSQIWQMGQSVTVTNANVSIPQQALFGLSPVMWANRLTNQRLSLDFNEGYKGANQGLLSVNIMNGGTGGTPGQGACTSGTGTGVVLGQAVFNAAGTITSVPVVTPGSGLTSAPTITCPGAGAGTNIIGIVGGGMQWGNPGENSCQIYNRRGDYLPSIAAGDLAILFSGVNDPATGLSLTASIACSQSLFNSLLAVGAKVLWIRPGPRGVAGNLNGTSTPTLTQAQEQDFALSRWVDGFAQMQAAKNPQLYPNFLVVDAVAEATLASGAPQTGWTTDTLHENRPYAWARGYKLAAAIRQMYPILPGPAGNNGGALDIYNATYNPSGSVQANPGMTGTGGGLSGSATGVVATGYNLVGTLTGTGGSLVGSIESDTGTPRTDGLPGSRQVITLTCPTSGASATQGFSLSMSAFSQFPTYFPNGSRIVAQAYVEPTNFLYNEEAGILFNVKDSGGTNVEAINEDSTASASYVLPNTGTVVGDIPAPGPTMRWLVQTPIFTVTNSASATGAQTQAEPTMPFSFDCTKATAPVIVKVSNFTFHAVQ